MTHFKTFALLAATLALLTGCTSAEDRATTYLERAQASFEAEDYVKAKLDVKNTLQIQPDNVDALQLMADIAEKDSDMRGMYGALNKVVNLDPTRLESRLKLARLNLLGKQYDAVAEHVNAILAAEPDNPDARVLNATLMVRDGQVGPAREEVEAVLAAHPGNVSAVTFMVSRFFKDEPDKSLEILNAGIAATEDDSTLRVFQIRLLEEMGRTSEAEGAYQSLIASNPDKPSLEYALAKFYINQDRIDDAEAVYRGVVSARPDDATAKMRLAQFLATSRTMEDAMALLEEYAAAEPLTFEFQTALGRGYEQTGDPAQAETVFRRIIEADGTGPAGLAARNRIAQIKLREGDRPAVEALIAEVLDAEAGNPDALLLQAVLQVQDGQTQDAITGLRTILRNDPTAERPLLLIGKAHLQAGDTGLAKEKLRQLVEAHPGSLEGVRLLAQLLVRDKDWESVRNVLRAGLARHPDDLQMSRLLVDTLVQMEDWDAADQLADQMLERDGSVALGHFVKGRVALQRADLQQAITSFEAALALEPAAVEALSGLTRAYVRLEDLDGAKSYLTSFAEKYPDNVHALTLLGEVEGRKRNWDAAIANNERALELNAKWVPAYRNLVGIHFENQDLDTAIDAINRGLEQLPDNLDLKLLLANARERQEQFDEAIAIYEAVLAQNPTVDLAANNLAALIADHQMTDERLQVALTHITHFRDKSNPIFLDTLGWLYYRMGDLDQAIPLLERAVAGAGQIPQLRYHLGMAYYTTDRLDGAKQELQAAVDNATLEFDGLDEARATLDLL